VLSPGRRSALTAWARDTGGLIIEDDYDAEFRYDRDPVGCVQGRAPGHVALAGSVSKTLAPSLRVGWVLAPAWLAAALADGRLITDLGSPVLTQATLAVFLAGGGYDQHVRAMRRLYRGRRDALVAALERLAPELRLHGISAGLHLYAELTVGHDEAAVVTAAARRGLAVEGVSGMRSGTARRQAHPALVLGYAAQSDRVLREAAGLLAAAFTDVRQRCTAPGPAVQR
jgi:GntR family transcriptional regulator / MocR family aminotransferase